MKEVEEREEKVGWMQREGGRGGGGEDAKGRKVEVGG